MKINKTLIAAGVGLLAFAGVAISQVRTPPQVSIVNPTDLIAIVPLGQPKSGSVYATPSQITSQSGYQKSSSTTPGTLTFANSQEYIVLHAGSGITSLTIVMAAAPSDGARVCMFSTQTVTTLVLSPNTGQTINNGISAMTANVQYCYLYSLSNLTWDRNN